MYCSQDAPPKSFYDVTIVGGGMVGLSLAFMLSKQQPHLSIAVIESHRCSQQADTASFYQPSFDARSSAVSAGSVEIFQQLGLWSSLSQHATEICSVHVSDKGHMGRTLYQTNDLSKNTPVNSRHGSPNTAIKKLGFVLENAWLGKQLRHAVSQCSSVTYIDNAHVSKLSFTRQGATMALTRLDKTYPIASQLVVLADGAGSSVAKSIGIETLKRPYNQHAIITNLKVERAHEGRAFERFTVDGPMALLPLGESPNARTCALVYTCPSQDVESRMALNTHDFLQCIQTSFGFRLGRFLDHSQRYHYPLSLQQASEQVRRSLVLMGNAAHFLHPVAGQGFNLALRDCAALTHFIAQAIKQGQPIGDLSVLTQYLNAQLHDQQITTTLSDQFNRLFSHSHPAIKSLRTVGLMSLESVEPVKQSFFRQMMGLGGTFYS